MRPTDIFGIGIPCLMLCCRRMGSSILLSQMPKLSQLTPRLDELHLEGVVFTKLSQLTPRLDELHLQDVVFTKLSQLTPQLDELHLGDVVFSERPHL